MTLTGRREALCQAALDVIAERGLRGLTHRAVDRRAEVPEGTTSAYYRSRSALQSALATYVAELLSADVAALAEDLSDCDLDDPRATQLVARRFTDWLHDGTLVLARIELVLEATRDPGVADALAQVRERIVAVVAAVLLAHGIAPGELAARRAEVMVAAYDGVLLTALLRTPAERATFLDLAVSEILAPLHRSGSPQPKR